MKNPYLSFLLLVIVLSSCIREHQGAATEQLQANTEKKSTAKKDHQVREVRKAQIAPTLDGDTTDVAWQAATWYPIDQVWLGEPFKDKDFQGRFKFAWTEEALYLLVEVVDDVLYDQYEDPFHLWWDDDCVEIFVDEDNSGGEHQFNHNAFAYHVALDGNVVDLAPNGRGRLYNEHVATQRNTVGQASIWEHRVLVFKDDYKDGEDNKAVKLASGKRMGFMLAYCDNDASKERESFIGSVPIAGKDKNQGYKNASVFGTIVLVD